LHNFLAVRLIFTVNIPIDSGWQAQKNGIIKKFPYSTLGKQQGTLCE
jgi:hypothetical protein